MAATYMDRLLDRERVEHRIVRDLPPVAGAGRRPQRVQYADRIPVRIVSLAHLLDVSAPLDPRFLSSEVSLIHLPGRQAHVRGPVVVAPRLAYLGTGSVRHRLLLGPVQEPLRRV